MAVGDVGGTAAGFGSDRPFLKRLYKPGASVVGDDAINAQGAAGCGDGRGAIAVTHGVSDDHGKVRAHWHALAPAIGVGENARDDIGRDRSGDGFVSLVHDGSHMLGAVDGACIERFSERVHAHHSDDVGDTVGNDRLVTSRGFEGTARRAVGFDSDKVDPFDVERLCWPVGFDAADSLAFAALAADDEGRRSSGVLGDVGNCGDAGQWGGREDERQRVALRRNCEASRGGEHGDAVSRVAALGVQSLGGECKEQSRFASAADGSDQGAAFGCGRRDVECVVERSSVMRGVGRHESIVSVVPVLISRSAIHGVHF